MSERVSTSYMVIIMYLYKNALFLKLVLISDWEVCSSFFRFTVKCDVIFESIDAAKRFLYVFLKKETKQNDYEKREESHPAGVKERSLFIHACYVCYNSHRSPITVNVQKNKQTKANK